MADKTDQFIELPNVDIIAGEENSSWNDDSHVLDPYDAYNLVDMAVSADSGPNASFVGNSVQSNIKDLSHVYGNNVFDLAVDYLASPGGIHITGVLQEMPTLSRTANWNDALSTNLISSLKKIESNSMYQVISSILNAPQIPLIMSGPATIRKYDNSSRVSFNLKFRIYSQQAIGPSSRMTGYKRALAILTLYTTALHSADIEGSLKILIANVGSVINNGVATLTNLTDYADQKATTDNPDFSENSTAQKIESAGASTMIMLESIYDVLNANTDSERAVKIKNMSTQFKSYVETVEKILAGEVTTQLHNDKERVKSDLNTSTGYFGGAIWNLTILPGVFKYSIPVYISNWSAQLSKEIDSNGDAAYCDFNITCAMDQEKSSMYWINQIYSNDYDAYKEAFKKAEKAKAAQEQ